MPVMSLICIFTIEMGWSPSLVTMKKIGRNPCSAKLMVKIFAFCGLS